MPSGVSSFADKIKGRDVIIFSDNAGAEGAMRKGSPLRAWPAITLPMLQIGSARQFDHTCLTHALWKHLLHLNVEAQIQRVPTDDNLADLPSRGCYKFLQYLGIKRVKARLDQVYLQAQTWEQLSLRTGSCPVAAPKTECIEID